MTKIQVAPEHLTVIKNLLKDAKIIVVFGSRSRGDANKFSDLDICLLDNPPPSSMQMELWREAFDNSNLPYTVDLSRWDDLPEFMQITVQRGGIRL